MGGQRSRIKQNDGLVRQNLSHSHFLYWKSCNSQLLSTLKRSCLLARKCPLAMVAMVVPKEAVGWLMDTRGPCQAESVGNIKRLAVSAPVTHGSHQLKSGRSYCVVFIWPSVCMEKYLSYFVNWHEKMQMNDAQTLWVQQALCFSCGHNA